MVHVKYRPGPRWTTTDGAESGLSLHQLLILDKADAIERLEVGVSDVASLRRWSHVPQPVSPHGSSLTTLGSPLRAFLPGPPVGPMLGLPLTLTLVHAVDAGPSAVSLVTSNRERFVGLLLPTPSTFHPEFLLTRQFHESDQRSLSSRLNICSPPSTAPGFRAPLRAATGAPRRAHTSHRRSVCGNHCSSLTFRSRSTGGEPQRRLRQGGNPQCCSSCGAGSRESTGRAASR
jgi:hypothetical protein